MPDFDYQQLDDIIHSRIRLAVMAVLVSVESAVFTFLKDKVGATDGNLSVHLRKLEEAGYISAHKRFVNRKPLSSYRITAKGRKAFEIYIERLEKLIKNTTIDDK
jgi:DNA-binding HxlR family transcriptional regulator